MIYGKKECIIAPLAVIRMHERFDVPQKEGINEGLNEGIKTKSGETYEYSENFNQVF